MTCTEIVIGHAIFTVYTIKKDGLEAVIFFFSFQIDWWPCRVGFMIIIILFSDGLMAVVYRHHD